MTTKIIGIGSYVPDTVVTNQDLMKFLDTDDAWIRERTGICERRVSKDMGTCGLAIEAAKRAIDDAGIDPKEIDLIVLATSSGDRAFPAAAMDVQAAIGAVNAVGFDITAACSGFIFGLHIAHSFFAAGIYKTALIIGAETLSKVVDWTDRGTCILFGDGAGAAVVRASETGIIRTLMGSDGTKGWTLECQARNLGNCVNGIKPELGFMKMDGKEVFKFAVRKVPEIVAQILEDAQMDPEEIKYFVLHQANFRILEAASRRLKVPMDRIPVNIDRYGNTSAASVPILLDELKRDGKLERGDKLVLAGFGAGMTWGATLLEW
ncbi:MAG: ketoacyl-ACP synthase III [Clostridium sp.]|nr:ketoacyl-ACP synthase III [Clostridium sp.]